MLTPLFLLEEVLNDNFQSLKPITNPVASKAKYYLKREKDSLVFRAAALGLKKNDISMSIENKHLTVKSKADKDSFFNTNVNYNIYVGDDILRENTSASLEDGILTVTMPVSENKKVHQITF